jgi:ubiquitin-activating enzyme E1-like protein
MSNAIPPSVTPPSPNEWPNTLRTVTNIGRNSNTIVTAPNHGFTSQDEGVTTVIFLQVNGMRQINGLPGRIQQVVDTNTFTVNINSTNFYPYVSDGVISIVTGHPPIETESFQTFNTPFQNIA